MPTDPNMREVVNNDRGEPIGERWNLNKSDVRTLLAALQYHAGSVTMGAARAEGLADALGASDMPGVELSHPEATAAEIIAAAR